jgi:hypothetical protein
LYARIHVGDVCYVEYLNTTQIQEGAKKETVVSGSPVPILEVVGALEDLPSGTLLPTGLSSSKVNFMNISMSVVLLKVLTGRGRAYKWS